MAKWSMPDTHLFEGAVRAVNYVTGHDESGKPIINHRLEQFGPWGWQPIPVYHQQPDGSWQEIPQ
jgi:hypothetical protein